jgi:Flp pilus assembly pilin Flp
MGRFLRNACREDDGVLSFEWTLVAVLVVFGVVGGLAAARDVVIDELGDLCQAVVGFDQSFSYSGITALGIPGASYNDVKATVDDSSRPPAGFWGIAGRDDGADGS